MRRVWGLLGLVAITVWTMAGPVSTLAHADAKDFTVRNTGSAAIDQVYVSPNFSSSWESDALGPQPISPGAQTQVPIKEPKDHCIYDIRIEDAEGHIKELYDEDLCQPRTFNYP